MGLLDGQVIGTSLVVDHGDAARRFNLIIVAEGFQLNELGYFATLAKEFIDYFFSVSPFDSLKCAFNIFRLDVASTDSGADDPPICGGDGSVKATRFDASFCNGGIRRLLCVDTSAVIEAVEASVPEWHQILVIVNSSVYGGSGGNVAVTSAAGSWKKVALHEIGHSVFGLADEYPYWSGCAVDTTRNRYPGGEPVYPNITTVTDRNMIKWKDMILSGIPIPTTSNPDCSKCDTQSDPFTIGTVGTYEGAFYYHCGIYRPEYHCMMRDLSGFCAVCRKHITEILSVYLEKCYAPIFKPIPVILCMLLRIVLGLIIIIFQLISFFTNRFNCMLKRAKYLFKFCSVGNDNHCIAL